MWTRENRGRMADIARKTRRYPSDLTDAEWGRIAPLIPKPPPRGRKPAVDFREILNAIRYMARSAGGWRMLPSEFGPWQTVYCSNNADYLDLGPHPACHEAELPRATTTSGRR